MLKRLQNRGREKDNKLPRIGHPVLLETTYDESQLKRNPNVVDLRNANYQPDALSPQSQPQYTLSTLPSPEWPDHRASEVPTLSSTYSPTAHDLDYYYLDPTAIQPSALEEISPPSTPEPEDHLESPDGQPRRFRSMRDVSPMDENRKKFEDQSRRVSQIPVLRRAPPGLLDGELQSGPKQKFWGGKAAPNSKVKWDVYSGEPTSSQAGKASSVNPVTFAKEAGPVEVLTMGNQASISGPERRNMSLAERVSRLGGRPLPGSVEPLSRTSGRSQIASPLRDDPSSKPLQVPRKPVSKIISESDRAVSPTVVADTATVSTAARDNDTHEDLIKPIVPLKVGRNSPPRNGIASPTSSTFRSPVTPAFSYPSPITPTQKSPLPVTPTREEAPPIVAPVPRSATTPPYNLVEETSAGPTPEKDKQAPTSRFSWTTYNSATTYQHSPPPSPPPPLPFSTVPVPRQRVVTEPIPVAASILERKRPLAQANRLPATRKSLPGATDSPGTANIQAMYTSYPEPPSPSRASTYSTATTGTFKALPQPPTSLSAVDHISLLESQQEDLRVRRSNVYRLLSDLNNAAPPNPLVTDFRRARQAEQQKRLFEEELSEIKREEYEIGMKLHRAWKKREKEDPNTGSPLWVRRAFS